nr:F-box/FBD/LRR-repeat protein At1g13570-like [Ipomoea batatas]
MARRRRRLKTLPDASRDLISELPVEVKDRILECLPTRDAARTALLSRHWNDVWLQHEQLTFDCEFVENFGQGLDDDRRTLVNVINNILFARAGPVKKFTLEINADCDPYPLPQQSDIEMWNASEVVRNIQRKLECFPRASPNAQIVCTCNDNARMSEDWMDTHGVRLLARLRFRIRGDGSDEYSVAVKRVEKTCHNAEYYEIHFEFHLANHSLLLNFELQLHSAVDAFFMQLHSAVGC